MNNLISEERKKEDKEHMIAALYVLMWFPILFCYYGFLVLLIQKKKKYGLDISVSDINFNIAIYSTCIGFVLFLCIGLFNKIFPKFENSFWFHLSFFMAMFFVYLVMGAAFAVIWLFNI